MVTLDKHIWQIAPVDGDQGRSTQIISSMLLYYRPMPAKDFEALLDGGNSN